MDRLRYRFSGVSGESSSLQCRHALIAKQVYASVLATLNVYSSARVSYIYSFHLTSVTLAVCALYAYRDVWPLWTFTLHPIDQAEGGILWAKVALALFISVIEPLFEPYPYVPVDPKVRCL